MDHSDVGPNKSSNIIHNSSTNPGIRVVVLVEITECAPTGKMRNRCIRGTELKEGLEYPKIKLR